MICVVLVMIGDVRGKFNKTRLQSRVYKTKCYCRTHQRCQYYPKCDIGIILKDGMPRLAMYLQNIFNLMLLLQSLASAAAALL